jgi:hypothetical protein
LFDKLVKDCIDCETDNVLNSDQVTHIWNKAYSEKKSTFHEVFWYFEELCEFVRETIRLGAKNE